MMFIMMLENGSDATNKTSGMRIKCTTEACKDIMPSKEYCKYIRNFNARHTEIVMHNCAWCKAVVISNRKGETINGYQFFNSSQNVCCIENK